MFARLGLTLGCAWFVATALLLDNAGNMNTQNVMDISLIPAAVIAGLGVALTWVLGGLFGD